MTERVKLQVTDVSEPKEVGEKGARKVVFRGKSPDGKELSYFTFKTSLFDTIKTGKEIEAEVEVKTREYDGNTYTDRQINQIFVDGKPVGGQVRQWQGRGDNPEQRASIETQVAVKTITELRIADKLPEDSREYKAMLAWCRVKLNIPDIVQTGESKSEGKPKTPPGAPEQATSPAEQESNAVPVGAKQPQDLGIDMGWVKDSMKQIKWTEATIKSYLANIAKISKEGSLEDVIARLNQEQKAQFVKEIQDRLQMK